MKKQKKDLRKKDWEKIEVELKNLQRKKKFQKPLTETIKNLVGFHRREIKPEWWETFDRMDKTHDELEEDPNVLVIVF